jgi:hypothetical protein
MITLHIRITIAKKKMVKRKQCNLIRSQELRNTEPHLTHIKFISKMHGLSFERTQIALSRKSTQYLHANTKHNFDIIGPDTPRVWARIPAAMAQIPTASTHLQSLGKSCPANAPSHTQSQVEAKHQTKEESIEFSTQIKVRSSAQPEEETMRGRHCAPRASDKNIKHEVPSPSPCPS